jgi:hypothetical protein
METGSCVCGCRRRDLMSPLFGDLDGLVVLADLLSAPGIRVRPHSLTCNGACCRFRRVALTNLTSGWPRLRGRMLRGQSGAWPLLRQSRPHRYSPAGNLAALMRRVTHVPEGGATSSLAIASVRVRGYRRDAGRPSGFGCPGPHDRRASPRALPWRSSDGVPDDSFWQHRFLALPEFEPVPAGVGRGGIPQVGGWFDRVC